MTSLKEFILADMGAAALFRVGEETFKKVFRRGGDAAAEAAAKAAENGVKRAEAVAARRAEFENQLRSIHHSRRRKFARRYEEAIRAGKEDRFIGLVTETEPHPTRGWVPFVLWGERVSDKTWSQHLEVLDSNPWEQRWTRLCAWVRNLDTEWSHGIRDWRERQGWFRSGRVSLALVGGIAFLILAVAGWYILFAAGAGK